MFYFRNQINYWNEYGDKSLAFYKSLYENNFFDWKTPTLANKIIKSYDNFPENLDLNNVIYTSHEGLLLNYEECFVRRIEDKYYALSGHFLWIGIFLYKYNRRKNK